MSNDPFRLPSASRRGFLGAAAALAATGGGLPLIAPAAAKAPLSKTQPAYFYRFMLGTAEVTVVSDGPLPLGDPGTSFLGVPKDTVYGMLESSFLPKDNVVLEQNIPIVNFGDRLVMFDTGMGFSGATSNGVGLRNAQERLRVLYGERQAFIVRNREPRGVEITLRLPFEHALGGTA